MTMEQPRIEIQPHIWSRWQIAIQAVGIFLLAFIPRVIALQHFVTADEAKWVYRSAQFLSAFLRGDFAATAVNLTPAVTTTWLGSAGLAVYYQQHQFDIGVPFTDWLATLPQFRVELPILAAVRWPQVILTTFAIVAIFLLARRLWNNQIAFFGAVLLALDPHTLALSRVIGHDAPAAIFMTLSVLSLLITTRQTNRKTHWLILSGTMAGLAFLSKSPALFLIPFAGLVLWINHTKTRYLITAKHFVIWSFTAYAIFVIIWPAAWVAPIQQPFAIIENAFRSATRADTPVEASVLEAESTRRIPNLGPAYYLVNGAFKLSPIVAIGLAIATIIALRKENRHLWRNGSQNVLVWLALFSVLFIVFMTLGGKRSNRYILPIFPALSFIAAWGWTIFIESINNRIIEKRTPSTSQHPRPPTTLHLYASALILTLSALLLLPYAPYYFTYFNPLLGGPITAPKLIKVGWGEGLDRAGRWLDTQSYPATTKAGSWYASALSPFYQGDIADISSSNLDYVILYLKQLQDDQPHPAIASYFSALDPLHTIQLDGINYAKIYSGPTAKYVSPEAFTQTGIVAFRSSTEYVPIGDDLTIDLIWLSEGKKPTPLPPISLQRENEVLTEVQAREMDETTSPSLQLPAPHVWRYTLPIPDTFPPGETDLYANGVKLGSLRAFQIRPPDHFIPADTNFGDQIKLVGHAPEVSISGHMATVELAFQANPKVWHDYTVFVHLITNEGDRLTGHDAPPNFPSSQWHKAEIVLDSHTFTLPPDLLPGTSYQIRTGLYRSDTGEPLGEPVSLPIDVRIP